LPGGELFKLFSWAEDTHKAVCGGHQPVEGQGFANPRRNLRALAAELRDSGNGYAIACAGLVHALKDLAEPGTKVEAHRRCEPLGFNEPTLP
jgi:hypothetical protein